MGSNRDNTIGFDMKISKLQYAGIIVVLAAVLVVVLAYSAYGAPYLTALSANSPANNTWINASTYKHTEINITASESLYNATIQWWNGTQWTNASMTNRSLTAWYINVSTGLPLYTNETSRLFKYNFFFCNTSGVTDSTKTRGSNVSEYWLLIDLVNPVINDIWVLNESNNSVLQSPYTMHINLTASDDIADPINVSVNNASGNQLLGSTMCTNNTRCTITFSLTANAFTCIKIKAIDNASAQSSASDVDQYCFTIDSLAPATAYVSPTEATNTWKSDEHYFVNISFSHPLSATVAVLLDWNGTNYTMGYTGSKSAYFKNMTGLVDGYYYYYTSATDEAGNINVTTRRYVIIDNTAPEIAMKGAVASVLDNTMNPATASYYANSKHANFSWTLNETDIIGATENASCTLTLWNYTNGDVTKTVVSNNSLLKAYINGTTALTVQVDNLGADTAWNYTINCSDLASNTVSLTRTVIYDNTTPTSTGTGTSNIGSQNMLLQYNTTITDNNILNCSLRIWKGGVFNEFAGTLNSTSQTVRLCTIEVAQTSVTVPDGMVILQGVTFDYVGKSGISNVNQTNITKITLYAGKWNIVQVPSNLSLQAIGNWSSSITHVSFYRHSQHIFINHVKGTAANSTFVANVTDVVLIYTNTTVVVYPKVTSVSNKQMDIYKGWNLISNLNVTDMPMGELATMTLANMTEPSEGQTIRYVAWYNATGGFNVIHRVGFTLYATVSIPRGQGAWVMLNGTNVGNYSRLSIVSGV